MARLTLVDTGRQVNTNLAVHRASATEGEAALKLLEAQGFVLKRKANGQYELPCPFHEAPGAIPRSKGTNFYLNATTSTYYCQAASCGERGNLQTLEKFFGIDVADDYVVAFRDRDTRLKEFERNLTTALRKPFYEHGLTDATIERFRLGYELEHYEEKNGEQVLIPARYVIPYLEGRRPKFFRYYAPDGDPKWKYTWEAGAESSLFNAQDAMGDPINGMVVICEGEQKAMMLVQMGYAAVAVPGAAQWKDEWQAAFTHARRVLVCYDNDNPLFHNYDKPEKGQTCQKCRSHGLNSCVGHNPGQDAAIKRVEQIGWRAKNCLLPLPDETFKKTDVNDFFMRDGHSNADFAELVTGKRQTMYKVQTLAEIAENPPEEAVFLVEHGILPKGGRLLIAGRPKAGKSILVDNMALSLAAGIPFLGQFGIDHPTRTLLLDRELSKRSLFSRFEALSDKRPGYKAAWENLMIDHDHLVRLDQPGAYDTLAQLVDQNGAEVLMLDTAYKFLGGDVESSSALMKAFAVLDKLIHETGVSIVMTHHLRKGAAGRGKENTDVADPEGVVGSFLWTGWPNGTILLNFLNRSVEDPFNTVATFTAFRDTAPPEPLALYRDRDSIAYRLIQPHSHEEPVGGSTGWSSVQVTKPDTDAVEQWLLELCPTTEDDFLHIVAAKFGVSIPVLKPYYIDAMARGNFERGTGKPTIIKFKEPVTEPEETWEHEHGLADRPFDELAEFDEEADPVQAVHESTRYASFDAAALVQS